MHCYDRTRGVALTFDLPAQLSNVLVERSRGAEIIYAPDGVQERVARQNFARVRREDFCEL